MTARVNASGDTLARIRELEARLSSELNHIKVLNIEASGYLSRAERAERERDATFKEVLRLRELIMRSSARAEKAEAALEEMGQRSDIHLDKWKAAEARVADLERRNEALIAHHNDVCPGGVIEREPAPAIEGHEREAD